MWGWPKTGIQGCVDQSSVEALQSYLPWLRNVWRNFLHVGNRFSLTGCACCAKMPASSSEIFTKAGSCRNKLNRTTSNFTTEMKTACGVIKNQASNRQKKCGYCLPRVRKPFWNFSLIFQAFQFSYFKVIWPLNIAASRAYCLQRAAFCLDIRKSGCRPAAAHQLSVLGQWASSPWASVSLYCKMGVSYLVPKIL